MKVYLLTELSWKISHHNIFLATQLTPFSDGGIF